MQSLPSQLQSFQIFILVFFNFSVIHAIHLEVLVPLLRLKELEQGYGNTASIHENLTDSNFHSCPIVAKKSIVSWQNRPAGLIIRRKLLKGDAGAPDGCCRGGRTAESVQLPALARTAPAGPDPWCLLPPGGRTVEMHAGGRTCVLCVNVFACTCVCECVCA